MERNSLSSRYNKAAQVWVNGGRDQFMNLVFNLTDSSGKTKYNAVSTKSGLFYPTRDRCNKKGDPKEGCLYTEAMYYDEDILWMDKGNYFTIEDSQGNVIRKETNLSGSLNYTRSAKELGCRHHLYGFGFWLIVETLAKSVAMR